MSKGTTQELTAAFFSAGHHDFKETKQSSWITFAANTSQFICDILNAPNVDISLIEILEILAKERNKFAKQQTGIPENQIERFGQWRDKVYSLSLQQSSIALQRKKDLDHCLQKAGCSRPVITIDVFTTQTCYTQKHPFFNCIMANLSLCETNDSENIQIIPKVDNNNKPFIDELIKKKFNISPPSFFDIVSYKKYTLADNKDPKNLFTNIIMTSNPSPSFFIAIEHTQPNVTYALLNNHVSDLFQTLLNTKEDKSVFIEKLAEFLWYCYHLMPFERGSASIFLIFTSSLLQLAKVPLKPYPENRMDIDAISLTQSLFTKKFIAVYS